MSNISASTDFSHLKDEAELKKYLDMFGQNVVSVVNGKLDFQTNFNAKLISITFTAALSDTQVLHGLGRSPSGYIVTGLSAQMIVSDGTVANTTSVLTLQSSAAGTAKLLVY
jgi:hypothetical protein